MSEQRLPYGKQISPEQIELRKLLELVRDAGGVDKDAHAAIGKEFFPKPGNEKNEVTSGMNCFLSMRHYGLVESTKGSYVLTGLATDLLSTKTEDELLATFARHILLNLNGLQMVEVIDSLHARGRTVKAESVASELLAIGIEPGGTSGENINPLRLWLEKAGVVDKWDIDAAAVKRLTGAAPDEISDLVALPRDQQALLRALATTTDVPPIDGNKLRNLAEVQTPGLIISIKQFAPITLKRLEAEGWITVTKVTGGRGAKPHQVQPTQNFIDTISEPLMDAVLDQVHLMDPASLRKPLNDLLDIVDDMAKSNHARGLALEGVCIQVVRMLGARFMAWRLRGDQTSGAEVDVVAETLDNPYLLYQIQSKASAINGREIIDREVGVAGALKSNVILFVSAQKVGPAARRAAASHMQESNLAILFLDGKDLRGGIAGIAAGIAREWGFVRLISSRRNHQRAQSFEE